MDIIFHALCPLLILVAFRVAPKKALFMLPFALVPDIDVLLGMHRSVLHSFIPVLIIPACFIVFCYLRKKEWFVYSLIIQFYLLSHILFDLSDGVGFLSPFTQDFYFVRLDLYFSFWGPIPLPDLRVVYGAISPLPHMSASETLQAYATVNEVGFMMLLVVLVFLLMFMPRTRKLMERAQGCIVRLQKRIVCHLIKKDSETPKEGGCRIENELS